METRARPVLLALALVLAAAARVAEAADADTTREARRVLSLVRGIGEEYREALDDAGRVVRPLELDEARLLLAEARDHGARFAAPLAGQVTRGLARLEQALEVHPPVAEVDAAVAELQREVTDATGVGEELFP